jgi:hypothetical protein
MCPTRGTGACGAARHDGQSSRGGSGRPSDGERVTELPTPRRSGAPERLSRSSSPRSAMLAAHRVTLAPEVPMRR